MRVIPLFVLLFFLSSCINERFFDSLGEQVQSVIDKANQTGGGGGIAILNKEISKLEDKLKSLKEDVTEKEDELAEAEDDLEETEEELDEIQGRLDEIKERLENDDSLTPEQRQELENERDRLRDDKSSLEEDKTALEREKNRLQGEVRDAESRVTDKENEIIALQETKRQLEADLATARGERDTARDERDTARGALSTAQEERNCWRKTRYSVCDRTDEVKEAIMNELSEIDDCSDVNYCHLEDIENLNLSMNYDPANGDSSNVDDCSTNRIGLQPGDFAGLTGLLELDLSNVCLDDSFMDRGRGNAILSGLKSIRKINLQDTGVYKLPLDFIEGLSSLNQGSTVDTAGILVTEFISCSKSSHSTLNDILGPSEEIPESLSSEEFCY